MRLNHLRCCGQELCLQVNERNPAFSWIVECDEQYDVVQQAYQIRVYDWKQQVVWDSGKVESDQSAEILYDGACLQRDSGYEWELTVWVNSLTEPLTGEARFETGLQDHWSGEWIGYDVLPDGMKPFDPEEPFYCADDFQLGENHYYLPPPPYLRKEFTQESRAVSAKLYISAEGLVDLSVNGKAVTQDWMVPGSSNYSEMVWSRAYDVTDLIQTGTNAIGAVLADGWYAGYIGLHNREWYGSRPRMLLELRIRSEDGSVNIIGSDGTWKASYGAYREADIFEGEFYDAEREFSGYDLPGFDDRDWAAVECGSEHNFVPTAHPGPPVREIRRFPVGQIVKVDPDRMIVDLGQYISGVLQITMEGEPGEEISIRHAEILNEQGELHLIGNRSARALDRYRCKGGAVEVFLPKFTYHGFRYAEIRGIDRVKIHRIEALWVCSDVEELTEFHSSSELVDRLFESAYRTVRCNMFENPTDVSARDERLGWGLESDHAMQMMTSYGNIELFLKKWAMDIWSSQHEDGSLEPIAPPLMMKDVEPYRGDLQTNYGIRILYLLYQQYGEVKLIRELAGQVEEFLEFLDRNSDRDIRFATTGDWLGLWESTDHSDVDHGYGDCSPGKIGTAHYVIILQMAAELFQAAGLPELQEKYSRRVENVRDAYRRNFIQRDGILRFAKQGEYATALAAGIFEEKDLPLAKREFRKLLFEKGRLFWRGGTPSSPYFLSVLKELGDAETANQFLISESYPGLGYMLDHGPGTLWERLDGVHEDGSLHPQVMNAMSHLGYTSMLEYLITGLVGIQSLEAGYHTFSVEPGVTGEIPEASAAVHSKYGKIAVSWQLKDGHLKGEIQVPANTAAEIRLPSSGEPIIRRKSGEKIPAAVDRRGQKQYIRIGSGIYRIETTYELDKQSAY